MLISTYAVVNYVNGRMTHTTRGLSKRGAYETAVVGEALNQIPGSRWHVMLFPAASERMDLLFTGETLRVCWQDYNPDYDTEHVLIVREEDYSQVFNNNILYNNLINNVIQ
jgi:hypothetical protein